MENSNHKTITFIGLRPGLLEKAAALAAAFHAWLRTNGSRAILVDERQGGDLHHHEDAPEVTVVIAEQAPATGAVVWTLTFAEARDTALAERISAHTGACCAVVDVDEKFPFLSGLRARAEAAWNETPFIEIAKFSPRNLIEAALRGEHADLQPALAELKSLLDLAAEQKEPEAGTVKKKLLLKKSPTAEAEKKPMSVSHTMKRKQRVDLLEVAELIGFSLPDMYRRLSVHGGGEKLLPVLADKTADEINRWITQRLSEPTVTPDRRRYFAVALLILLDDRRKKDEDELPLYRSIDDAIPEKDGLFFQLKHLNSLLEAETFAGTDSAGARNKLAPLLRTASERAAEGRAGIIDICALRLAMLISHGERDRERRLDVLQQASERLPIDQQDALGLRPFFAVNAIRLKMKGIL